MQTWTENGRVYKTRGNEVIDFIEAFCLNPKTEKLLKLDPEQKDFINEFYKMYWDEDESMWCYVYKNALRGEPRGGGKSTLAACLALFEVSPYSGHKAPQVQLTSASAKNTKPVYEPARDMVRLNPRMGNELDIEANKNLIWCEQNRGYIEKLAADGAGNFGGQPAFIVRDELHQWHTEKQVLNSEALMTSLGKYVNARCLTTSTAGSDKNSLLGNLYDQYMQDEKRERPNDGLTIVRDEERQFLFWWWEAPSGLAIGDPATWKIAHPASWITEKVIRAVFEDPNVTEDEFRRQYLNQWTKAANSWFQTGVWRDLKSDSQIPENARIQVAVDGGWSNDTTAVTWAYAADENSPVIVRAHVWATRPEFEHHTFVPGGTMDYGLVEDFIISLGQRYQVTEVVYDPRFFGATAKRLSEFGFVVPDFNQQGPQMKDATTLFHRLVTTGEIEHDGDPVLTDHVESTAAVMQEDGWKVFKLKQTRKIDAAVSAIMSVSRAKADLQLRNVSYIYRRRENDEGEIEMVSA